MFKKALLTVISTVCLFGGDLWEVGFQQGTSIYNIENSKKDRLSFECGESGGSIYLFNKGKEVNLKADEPINFIINDGKKLISVKEVNSSTVMADTLAWGNLAYEIPKAKKIIVEANSQKFTFEPSNLKELDNFIQACTQYETSDSSSTPAQTTNNNSYSSNTNTTATFDSNKPPFRFDIKTEYSPSYQMTYPLLIITSLDDRLIIKDVKINKGKCNAIPISERKQNINGRVIVTVDRAKLPVPVPEFEALKVNIASGCNILRLDIDTNAGIWPFESK